MLQLKYISIILMTVLLESYLARVEGFEKTELQKYSYIECSALLLRVCDIKVLKRLKGRCRIVGYDECTLPSYSYGVWGCFRND